MMACSNYTKICGEGVDSVIKDCLKADPHLPTSSDAEQNTVNSFVAKSYQDFFESCATFQPDSNTYTCVLQY